MPTTKAIYFPMLTENMTEAEITAVLQSRNPTAMDIGDTVPDDFDHSGYCSRNYWRFEDRVIKYLKEQGWQFPEGRSHRREVDSVENFNGDYVEKIYERSCPTGKFITTDGDSFGPLVRILFGAIKPDGTVVDIWHG